MNRQVERAATWMYRGLWGVLTKWFRVPDQPPTPPIGSGESVQSFRPSDGFLRYLKLQFWIWLFFFDAVILFLWFVLTAAMPIAGVWLLPVALAVAVVPDVVAYLAIHLRYDTTWYVLSQRSLRIRSGIWVINEATITFENIQNVTVESGPIERFFGIGNVIVETAGGGQRAAPSQGKGGGENLHSGEIAGISNATEVRQLILSRLQVSRSAGLGDDHSEMAGWSTKHVTVLQEIRDLLRR